MRKIIIVSVGISLLIIGVLVFKTLSVQPEKKEVVPNNTPKTVYVQTVTNTEIPIVVSANGNLVAKNKVELFAEVQGLLETSGRDFRPGVSFRKGETILKMNSNEFYATILAQRSNLQNLIASIMPDMRLDYPESYEAWYAYLKAFDVNQNTKKLPQTNSDREQLFVTAKNIYNTYYTIKNLEEKLIKYRITAPFNGTVTEANVNKGALVRSGQKLGEFINASVYELEVNVNAMYVNLLQKGKKVTLNAIEGNQKYEGTVTRINARVDQTTQTVTVYIEVSDKNLREGMYLEANIPVQKEKNAVEIDRKLLINNSSVFVVNSKTLDLVPVQPIHTNDAKVVVKGLPDGTVMLTQVLPNAYKGLLVNPVNIEE
jgi:multidrug efflux pump subunit AcrA (membrane-fusion protein)